MAARDRKELRLPTEDSAVHLKRLPRDNTMDQLDVRNSSRGPLDTPFQVSSQMGGLAKNERPFQKLENTYKIEPDTAHDGEFSACAVERLCESVLVERLTDCQYEPTMCRQLSQELAAAIMERIKHLKMKRYKLVAVVSIGSLKERPGLQFGSRCLWNQNTDTFATVKFTNGSLFAVAMVYGLYYE